MRILVFILALALATLPFGMGVMMASASEGHQMHMTSQDAGHNMPAQHHHGGKEMGFTVCGACVSITAQAGAQPAAPDLQALYLPQAQQGSTGMETLPATPPPRG